MGRQHKYIDNYNIGGVMTKEGLTNGSNIQEEVKRTKFDKQEKLEICEKTVRSISVWLEKYTVEQ